MARSNPASKPCSTRIRAGPTAISSAAVTGSDDGNFSPSRTTFASATRFRPGPGERRVGSPRLRRASSPFHHRNDASDTPRASANNRADWLLASQALTTSDHFAALILMPASLRPRPHRWKDASSCNGYANWGAHRLILRISAKRANAQALRAYFVGGSACAKIAGGHVLLDLHSEEEPDSYEESHGSLGALVPLRTELIHGDLRVAYLAWLLAVQPDEVSDENLEPPVPPGLSALSAAHAAFVEFLRIDEDLLAAAATASAADSDDIEAVRAWAKALSPRAKDQWLARAIEDPDLSLRAELRRQSRSKAKRSPRYGRRVADLRAAAEEIREKREQTERLTREKAKEAADDMAAGPRSRERRRSA